MNLQESEYNYWYDRVFGYFLRRVANYHESQDLTSQVLADFFLYPPEKISSDTGLIWKITKNYFYNYLRNAKKTDLIVDIENQKIVSEYSTEHNLRLETLQKCMEKKLNPLDISILKMSILEDFKSSTIGEKLGLSSDNVRQKLSRSLKKIRKYCKSAWF